MALSPVPQKQLRYKMLPFPLPILRWNLLVMYASKLEPLFNLLLLLVQYPHPLLVDAMVALVPMVASGGRR